MTTPSLAADASFVWAGSLLTADGSRLSNVEVTGFSRVERKGNAWSLLKLLTKV